MAKPFCPPGGSGGLISSRTGGGPLGPPCLAFGVQVGREWREGIVPLILTRFSDPYGSADLVAGPVLNITHKKSVLRTSNYVQEI